MTKAETEAYEETIRELNQSINYLETTLKAERIQINDLISPCRKILKRWKDGNLQEMTYAEKTRLQFAVENLAAFIGGPQKE